MVVVGGVGKVHSDSAAGGGACRFVGRVGGLAVALSLGDPTATATTAAALRAAAARGKTPIVEAVATVRLTGDDNAIVVRPRPVLFPESVSATPTGAASSAPVPAPAPSTYTFQGSGNNVDITYTQTFDYSAPQIVGISGDDNSSTWDGPGFFVIAGNENIFGWSGGPLLPQASTLAAAAAPTGATATPTATTVSVTGSKNSITGSGSDTSLTVAGAGNTLDVSGTGSTYTISGDGNNFGPPASTPSTLATSSGTPSAAASSTLNVFFCKGCEFDITGNANDVTADGSREYVLIVD